jgi:DNA-binding response OmpR family regulator
MNMPSRDLLIFTKDTTIADALRVPLAARGVSLRVAGSHDEASSEIQRSRPCVAIVDLALPDEGASHFLEQCRSSNEREMLTLPLAVLSENGDPVEIGNALRFKIVDYIVKNNLDAGAAVDRLLKKCGVQHEPSGSVSVPAPSTPTPGDQYELSREASALAQAAPVVAVKDPKVLIVEDDKFLRDLAIQKLEKERLVVVYATDGEAGVAMAEREHPDVILLDILLPGIDGFEVLRRIKANPDLASATVMMLSNFGQREDIEKALSLGAFKFLVKANYTLDEIVSEVRAIAHPKETEGSI